MEKGNEALFWQVVEKRKSIRKYSETPIPQEMLDRLVAAAKKAPVAGGNRNVTCQVFNDPERIREIADGTKEACLEAMKAIPDDGIKKQSLAYSNNFYWFRNAPALLAVSCRKTPSYMELLVKEGADDLFGSKASAAMAAQNIMLAATAQGLGSCCLTGPLVARRWLQKELGVPGQNELTMLITVGFPASKSSEEAPSTDAS